MKKKSILLLITCVIIGSLVGCGKRDTDNLPVPETSAPTTAPTTTSTTAQSQNDDAISESSAETTEKEYFLGGSDIFCLDENGEVSSIFTFPKNETAREIFNTGDEVYASGYVYGSEDEGVVSSYIHYLNLSDPSKNIDIEVPNPYDKYIYFIGIYEGKLYFKYNDGPAQKKIGTFEGPKASFGIDNSMWKYDKELQEEGYEQISYGVDVATCLVKYGKIYRKIKGTDVIVEIDSDGQVHELTSNHYEITNFLHFYGDYAIAFVNNYEGYNLIGGETYLYDIQNDSARVIDEFGTNGNKTYLDFVDGYLYFREDKPNLSYYDNAYYRMTVDKNTDEAELICTKTYNPMERLREMSRINALDQYKIGKNVFLYQKMNGYNLEWYAAYFDGHQTATGACISEVESAKFGTVMQDVQSYYDKEHGDPLKYYQYSIDRFRLKDGAVKNSAKIGLRLEELYFEFEDECVKNEEANRSMVEDDANREWLRETKENATDEMQFISAKMINDRYFQVTFEYLTYFEHAMHAEYAYTYRLFDTETGDEAGIKDLYPGTQEEYKKLVADYTYEYWKNAPEDVFITPYSEDEDEGMYKDFYNSVNYELEVDFGKDSFTVYYGPHMYTLINVGELGITIPYSDAGIKLG